MLMEISILLLMISIYLKYLDLKKEMFGIVIEHDYLSYHNLTGIKHRNIHLQYLLLLVVYCLS